MPKKTTLRRRTTRHARVTPHALKNPSPLYYPAVPRASIYLARYYRWRDRHFPRATLRRKLYNGALELLFPMLEQMNKSDRSALPWLLTVYHYFRGKARCRSFIRAAEDKAYRQWVRKYEPSWPEVKSQFLQPLSLAPLISLAVPVHATPLNFLRQLLESVRSQTYGNWELCASVDPADKPAVVRLLRRYAKRDARIRLIRREGNQGIAANTNAALEQARGDYVAFVDHDDLLPPHALFEVARAVNHFPEAEFLYSDEDKVTRDGLVRYDPHFKPEYSPDTLLSYNYISHLSVIKRSLLKRIGFLRRTYEGGQDYDLILRATENTRQIVHIPKILYHWRCHRDSTAGQVAFKPYALDASRRAVRDHLRRIGRTGQVQPGMVESLNAVRYPLRRQPLVSILIPNKDQAEVLRTCVDSVFSLSTYPRFEIILADTGSRDKKTLDLYRSLQRRRNVRLLRWTRRFNYSAVNNFAAAQAKGDILLLLNNDIEVLTPDWIERMLEHVQHPEIGAAGAKLYYPNGTIQHAGVILGLGGIAGHSHKHFAKDETGYQRRLQIIQNLSAVTAACLMVRREVYREVGGFDENFPLAFNDVDFCLRLRERGYLNLWTPYAELVHHESKTRGYDTTVLKQRRARADIRRFFSRWQAVLAQRDPYYSPHLTLDREDFSLAQ